MRTTASTLAGSSCAAARALSIRTLQVAPATSSVGRRETSASERASVAWATSPASVTVPPRLGSTTAPRLLSVAATLRTSASTAVARASKSASFARVSSWVLRPRSSWTKSCRPGSVLPRSGPRSFDAAEASLPLRSSLVAWATGRLVILGLCRSLRTSVGVSRRSCLHLRSRR